MDSRGSGNPREPGRQIRATGARAVAPGSSIARAVPFGQTEPRSGQRQGKRAATTGAARPVGHIVPRLRRTPTFAARSGGVARAAMRATATVQNVRDAVGECGRRLRTDRGFFRGPRPTDQPCRGGGLPRLRLRVLRCSRTTCPPADPSTRSAPSSSPSCWPAILGGLSLLLIVLTVVNHQAAGRDGAGGAWGPSGLLRDPGHRLPRGRSVEGHRLPGDAAADGRDHAGQRSEQALGWWRRCPSAAPCCCISCSSVSSPSPCRWECWSSPACGATC